MSLGHSLTSWRELQTITTGHLGESPPTLLLSASWAYSWYLSKAQKVVLRSLSSIHQHVSFCNQCHADSLTLFFFVWKCRMDFQLDRKWVWLCQHKAAHTPFITTDLDSEYYNKICKYYNKFCFIPSLGFKSSFLALHECGLHSESLAVGFKQITAWRFWCVADELCSHGNSQHRQCVCWLYLSLLSISRIFIKFKFCVCEREYWWLTGSSWQFVWKLISVHCSLNKVIGLLVYLNP